MMSVLSTKRVEAVVSETDICTKINPYTMDVVGHLSLALLIPFNFKGLRESLKVCAKAVSEKGTRAVHEP